MITISYGQSRLAPTQIRTLTQLSRSGGKVSPLRPYTFHIPPRFSYSLPSLLRSSGDEPGSSIVFFLILPLFASLTHSSASKDDKRTDPRFMPIVPAGGARHVSVPLPILRTRICRDFLRNDLGPSWCCSRSFSHATGTSSSSHLPRLLSSTRSEP